MRLLARSQDSDSDLSKSYDLVLLDDKLVVYSDTKHRVRKDLDLIATVVVHYSNSPDETGLAEIVSAESDAYGALFGFNQVLFSSLLTLIPTPKEVIPSMSHVKKLVKDLYDKLWVGLLLYDAETMLR